MHVKTRKLAPVALALVLAILPNAAFAYSESQQVNLPEPVETQPQSANEDADAGQTAMGDTAGQTEMGDTAGIDTLKSFGPVLSDKVLPYEAADLKAIGSQEESGHNACCPSYACAYADAVIDGTIHDHTYYTCSNCTWTDWGGGNSSFRDVGSDEELLREAYDQIESGKPTVVHVTWSGGEHWIALIGYHDVEDPDHLTLANFIALDPWDGAEIEADSKYSLYGDGCEHVSDR